MGGNVGYAVPRLYSGRESFSPDVSFYLGPPPRDPMKFISGPPTFAAEIRSECDYGTQAELEMTAKRLDYFEAGTLVVWDVDTRGACVNCYRISAMHAKIVFNRGQIADAEPAVPGWRISVDEIFGKR
ncbi:MAG TPA: Uma2 family endonuclease [Planctomycetota bacterium]|nr:Uma2 family endonuclease [Planctomycetota bacterium]